MNMSIRRTVLTLTILISICKLCTGAPSRHYCYEYIGEGGRSSPTDDYVEDNSEYTNEIEQEHETHNKTIKPGTIRCDVTMGSCYSVWQPKENGTSVLIRQGCWTKDPSCLKKECSGESRTSNFKKNFSFCCCTGDLCNQNYTTLPPEPPTKEIPPQIPNWIIICSPIIWICSTVTAIILMCVIIFIVCRISYKAEPENAPLAPSGPGYSSNLQNVDNLKLCAMIGQGKYGTVWKGMVNEKPVAVKIFPGQYRQYFLNERDIYVTPLMETPNLLAYYGCDQRRTMDDHIEYLLVLSLAPLGCLQDWLVDNTTTFSIFYSQGKSLAEGISHLHTQISKGDLIKPCICHRDLNSRNILVKSDLTLCICDFGFALKTFGPRYEYKGEMTLAETKSINEVGTLRYMAPEILEGAVNLRDCETALKQIDVYALGLILWELCTRCHDLYADGVETPPYKAPFEAEVGKNPTFEQMQVLVSKHKARPIFPPGWGNGPATIMAQETCEDCWDHDAEARLTAYCVAERLNEIFTFKSKINGKLNGSQLTTTNNLNMDETPLPPPPPMMIASTQKNENYLVFTPNTINLISAPPNQIITNGLGSDKLSDMTGDTLLSFSSTDEIDGFKHNDIYNTPNNKAYNATNGHCFDRNIAVINNINRIPTSCDPVEDIPEPTIISGSGGVKVRGWSGVRALLNKKIFKSKRPCVTLEDSDKSTLVDSPERITESMSNTTPTKKQNSFIAIPKSVESKMETHTKTSPTNLRPNNLNIRYSFNDSMSSDFLNEDVLNYRNLQNGQTYTLIKSPRIRHSGGGNQNQTSPRKIVISKSANAVKNLKQIDLMNEKQIRRQRSLEVFREVFNTKGGGDRTRDPSQRVKTPGDVPPSVRKMRGSKTLSLYDDRMMDSNGGNTL